MATMQRASFVLIMEKYKKRGKGNVRLTQSSLILIQPLSSTTKTYYFPMLTTESTPAIDPSEIRLNLNDEFTTYEVGYYLRANGSVVGSSPTIPGSWLLTYTPVELHADNLKYEAAWNAQMTISINAINRLQKWDMLKHKVIPRTQFQSWNNTALTVNPSALASQASLDYSKDGCILMQPMITFSGAKKNDVTIQTVDSLPLGGVVMNLVTPVGTIAMAIFQMQLVFRGMLAQNAAKFQ